MSDVQKIRELRDRYPGLTVRRDRGAVLVHVPMKLRRRKGQQVIITGDGGETGDVGGTSKDRERVNTTLIEAIAKGHQWQRQLEAGEFSSLEEIAREVGVDRSYVGRMLRLTSLAPDIIEAILRGDEPDWISLEKLRKDLPIQWDEQRKRWRAAERKNTEVKRLT